MSKTRDELAYCGVDCEECGIYRSVMLGETLSLETFRKWKQDFKEYLGIDSLEPEQLNCKGCRHTGEGVFYGFRMCPIRSCCKTHGLGSCGLCLEWKTCELHDVPEGRENLEGMVDAER